MKKWGHLSSYQCLYTQEGFSVALKSFAQAVTNCLLWPVERTKRAMFYILNHNSRSKHDF